MYVWFSVVEKIYATKLPPPAAIEKIPNQYPHGFHDDEERIPGTNIGDARISRR